MKLLQNGHFQFNPTQVRLSVLVLERIKKKMKVGLIFPTIKISGNSIIDGHHRYIASLVAHVEVSTTESKLTSVKEVTKWKSVELVEEDWDGADDVKLHNEKDALYNGMTVERLMELIA